MKDRTPCLPWETALRCAIIVGRTTQCKQRVYKDQVGWTWEITLIPYRHNPTHVLKDTITVPRLPVASPHTNTMVGHQLNDEWI